MISGIQNRLLGGQHISRVTSFIAALVLSSTIVASRPSVSHAQENAGQQQARQATPPVAGPRQPRQARTRKLQSRETIAKRQCRQSRAQRRAKERQHRLAIRYDPAYRMAHLRNIYKHCYQERRVPQRRLPAGIKKVYGKRLIRWP